MSSSDSDSDSEADIQSQKDLLELLLSDRTNVSISESIQKPKIQVEKELCIYCESEKSVYLCNECEDAYCEICYSFLHRTGNRIHHTKLNISNKSETEIKNNILDNIEKVQEPPTIEEIEEKKRTENQGVLGRATSYVVSIFSISAWLKNTDHSLIASSWWREQPNAAWFKRRAEFTPLRLPLNHRKYMRLITELASVSKYTDLVDIETLLPSINNNDNENKKISNKKMRLQLQLICGMLSGIGLCSDYAVGQNILCLNAFEGNAKFFQTIIEIGRRHKIRNPEKMIHCYLRFMYLLQDSQRHNINCVLGFSLVEEVETVYTLLHKANDFSLLEDPMMAIATGVILSDNRRRSDIDRDIKNKYRCIEHLCKKYATSFLSSEKIRQCIMSFNDNHSFLLYNRDPIDKMIEYLITYFDPDHIDNDEFNLATHTGVDGARLSHNHKMQYMFVLQTLTLWREILHHMFELWHCADRDVLDSDNAVITKMTNQGVQRIQKAPRVIRVMQRIMYKVQETLKPQEWIGSAVIHLGDDNVPNALHFIDKYNQVASILTPIVTCIKMLPELKKTPSVRSYIKNTYGSTTRLRLLILSDFFKKGFDGSGALLYEEAGSCIDGRLTSAWNWCSELETKPFYAIFKFTGFSGFNKTTTS